MNDFLRGEAPTLSRRRPNWERRHLGGDGRPNWERRHPGGDGRPNWERRHLGGATGTTGVPPVVKGTKQNHPKPACDYGAEQSRPSGRSRAIILRQSLHVLQLSFPFSILTTPLGLVLNPRNPSMSAYSPTAGTASREHLEPETQRQESFPKRSK